MWHPILRSAIFAVTLAVAPFVARAEEARLNAALPAADLASTKTTSNYSASPFQPLTMDYLSPTFGSVSLGLLSNSPLPVVPFYGLLPLVSPEFATSYKTQLYGSQFGMSAGYLNSASLFGTAPMPGWNLGASVGFAGFYLHAGISDATQQGLMSDAMKGWLAGFGYEVGALNLRLSYMTAQPLSTVDTDSHTWMIGGIYQISSRVRLNADAFTGRDLHALSTPITVPANATAPQGTGAHVGVQLRF